MIDLLKEWDNWKSSVEIKTENSLEYDYKKNNKLPIKSLISEALVFWKFIFIKLAWDKNNLTQAEWMRRKELMSDFLEHENHYIRTIAMIESLPTAIWRKILWKYNIDFMSFESFLRRLDDGQRKSIQNNYHDLFIESKIPRAFSRWNCFFRKLTMEKLFLEDYNKYQRYTNKGSWSYNLLNLDIGFNAYPNGIADDTKVIEVSPLRFLSVTHHVKDFVANSEDGKYWWLYRTARSNYVWCCNKVVQLNSHICPGFWYTLLLVHGMFWIYSPLAIVAFASIIICNSFHDTSWWIIAPLCLTAAFTPLWLLAAVGKYLTLFAMRNKVIKFIAMRILLPVFDFFVIKLVINSLISFFNFIGKYKKQLNSFGSGLVVTIFVGIACAIILLAGYYYWSLFLFIKSNLGLNAAISICLFIALFLGIIYCLKMGSKFTRNLILISMGLIAIIFFVTNPAISAPLFGYLLKLLLKAGKLLTYALTLFWRALVMVGIFGVLSILFSAIPFVLMYWSKTWDEQKQIKFFKILGKVLFFAGFLVLGLIINTLVKATFLTKDLIISTRLFLNNKMFIVLLVIGTILLINRLLIKIFDPAIKNAGQDLGPVQYQYVKEFDRWLNIYFDESMILKNAWLQSLNKDDRHTALKKASDLLLSIFMTDCEKRKRACKVLVPVMTPRIMARLDRDAQKLHFLNSSLSIKVFEKIVAGQSYDEALEMVKKEIARRKAFRQAVKNFFKVIFFWAIGIFKILCWLGKIIAKCINIIITLCRLKKYFTVACPYIIKKEVLTLD